MHFGDINWMDVESYLTQDNRVIVVLGSTEQHGYLSLLSDARLATALAYAAAVREQVLVAPPLNFGMSPDFVEFPGTLTLSEPTFHSMLYEIMLGLVQQGFRNILIVNGQKHNSFPPQIEALEAEVEDLYIIWYDWFESSAAHQFAAEAGLEIRHGNWSEAFSFNQVSSLPARAKPYVGLEELTVGMSKKDLLGDGSLGGPYQIENTALDRLFRLLVDELVELLQDL